jgi:hypothetical protein
LVARVIIVGPTFEIGELRKIAKQQSDHWSEEMTAQPHQERPLPNHGQL